MRFFYTLLLGFVFLSCSKNNSDIKETTVSNKLLRVLAYNIHHGTPINSASGAVELNNIAGVIKMQKPDLVALQEVDNKTRRAGGLNQAEELAKMLDMHYYFSKSINYDGGEYGVAILSKYPISKSERILLSNNEPGGEQRTIAMVTVELPDGKSIRFASIHLDLRLQNRTAQMQEIVMLSKQSALPLIAAGDFNAEAGSSEFGSLKTEFSLGCLTGCPLTFPADKPQKKIDFIVMNPAAAAKFSKRSYDSIKGQLSSDHLPLLGIYSY